MAAVVSSTPVRQPFGLLGESKLRNLQSVKNRQNAITPNSAPSLKRRAPSPDLSDSENVDPNRFDALGKRKKADFSHDVSSSKSARYNLQIMPSPTKPYAPSSTTTPRFETAQISTSAPLSAPAAAGRSPIRGKRVGILRPGKHFASSGIAPTLSITAALKGTLAHKKAKKARIIEESKPKSWVFDIFEESEEQQDYRMNEWSMTQSATILDISDDESKTSEKCDRGKENIDPDEITAPVTRSMSAAARVSASRSTRKDIMTEEAREPLGDLNASEYYGDGLDATSVVLVDDNVDDVHKPQSTVLKAESEPQPESCLEPEPELTNDVYDKADFTFESAAKLPDSLQSSIPADDMRDFLAASEPVWVIPHIEPEPMDAMPSSTTDDATIEIWESESAKDEGEKEEEMKLDEGCAFALQDL